MKIVMAGQYDPAVIEALSKSHDIVVFSHQITDPGQLRDADALVTRGHLRVDGALLSESPSLGLIVKAGSGTDNIDMVETSRRGVEVITTPASATAVAELALLLLLAVRRNLVGLMDAVRGGDWGAKYRFIGNELTGSRIGVVGFGLIAREFSRLARGFGMHVVAYDRSPDRSEKQACAGVLGIRFLPLDELLQGVDAVSVHVPLTASTRHMLGARELRRLRDGAVLVNTARAEIVERNALMEALRDGPLAGVGLDVHYQEPVPSDDPLLAMANVVCTPHIGAQTWETHREIGRQVVAAIERYVAQLTAGARPLRR